MSARASRSLPAVAAVLAAVWLLSLPAQAQQSIDILQQDVAVDLMGPDPQVQLVVQIEVTGPTSMLLMFATAFPSVQVQIDGVATTVSPHPSYPDMVLQVALPSAVTTGQQIELSAQLSGPPSCDSVYYPGMVSCHHSAAESIFPPGVRSFSMMNLYDTDPFVGEIEIRAPASHAVASVQGPAVLVEDNPDTSRTHRYAITQPTELLGFYAGEADVVTAPGDLSVRGFYHEGAHDAAKVTQAVQLASDILPVYGQLFGEPPFGEAAVVLVPQGFEFGGMGLLGMILLNEIVVGDYDFMLEQGVAHELGHSWWGNLASAGAPGQGPFFSESFTEYSAWLALGELQGEAVRNAGMRMNAVWYQYGRPNDQDIAIFHPAAQQSNVYVYVTYHKGPLVVRLLEETVGREAFLPVLKDFNGLGIGQLSADQLVADLLAQTGYDAAGDIEQWLNQEGFPKLMVQSTYNPPGAELQLSVIVDGPYSLQLPVRMTGSDGSEQTEVMTLQPGYNEQIFIVPQQPAQVTLDPAWTIVREVRPAVPYDVTLDGQVDGADLIAVALRQGDYFPTKRREDGSYDPLYDLNGDRVVDEMDLTAVVTGANPRAQLRRPEPAQPPLRQPSRAAAPDSADLYRRLSRLRQQLREHPGPAREHPGPG